MDILVIDEYNEFVFLIENKVYSSESKHQLNIYLKKIKKEFRKYDKYYIFLTKDLLEPRGNSKNNDISRQNYLLCSYNEVMDIIYEIIELNENGIISIKDETMRILENYKDLLVGRGIVEMLQFKNYVIKFGLIQNMEKHWKY